MLHFPAANSSKNLPCSREGQSKENRFPQENHCREAPSLQAEQLLQLKERFQQFRKAILAPIGRKLGFEEQYLYLLSHLLLHGEDRPNRTGTAARSIFGANLQLSLSTGFPLLTTKKVHFKSILFELLWFLRGETNIAWLQEHKISIWDEWADEKGELGPLYGAQWRSWKSAEGETIDQIAALVTALKSDPFSRRHILSSWNVGELNKMALAPCHCLAQFYVSLEGELSCQLYQRSIDLFLGLPFNIASYSLLTSMLAQVCRLRPGRFLLAAGDLHLYHNHFQQALLQIKRKPFPLPRLKLNSRVENIDSFQYSDVALENYKSHPAIPAPIAV